MRRSERNKRDEVLHPGFERAELRASARRLGMGLVYNKAAQDASGRLFVGAGWSEAAKKRLAGSVWGLK